MLSSLFFPGRRLFFAGTPESASVWSAESQNEQAERVHQETEQQLRELGTAVTGEATRSLQVTVRPGQTLGAIALGLSRTYGQEFSYRLPVEYRDGSKAPDKLYTLETAPRLFPGQRVSLEGGRVIVTGSELRPEVAKNHSAASVSDAATPVAAGETLVGRTPVAEVATPAKRSAPPIPEQRLRGEGPLTTRSGEAGTLLALAGQVDLSQATLTAPDATTLLPAAWVSQRADAYGTSLEYHIPVGTPPGTYTLAYFVNGQLAKAVFDVVG